MKKYTGYNISFCKKAPQTISRTPDLEVLFRHLTQRTQVIAAPTQSAMTVIDTDNPSWNKGLVKLIRYTIEKTKDHGKHHHCSEVCMFLCCSPKAKSTVAAKTP